MNQLFLFESVCIFFTILGEISPLNYVSEPSPDFDFFPKAVALPKNSKSPSVKERVPDLTSFVSKEAGRDVILPKNSKSSTRDNVKDFLIANIEPKKAGREVIVPEISKSPISDSVKNIPLANIEPKNTGRAYTILYPLTFENRGGKSLKITLQQPQPPEDIKVQSRVMNQPKLYPNFRLDIPLYNKAIESVPPELPPSSSDEYDDSDAPPIAEPPSSKLYNVKSPNFSRLPVPPAIIAFDTNYRPQPPSLQAYDKSYLVQPQAKPPSEKIYQSHPPPAQYNLKSPRFASFPPALQPSRPQSFDQSISLITYFPPLRDNENGQPKSIAPLTATTFKKPKSPPVPSPVALTKNTVPKYKVPPLQAYNKATFVPSPVVSQVSTSKLQPQFVSCICVPYYVCKDGVINSGGRLQAINKRISRSLKYDFYNKTRPVVSVQPETAGSLVKRQTTEPHRCQPNEICCQIYFSDNTDDADDVNYYPVATPPPEPPKPTAPRYPPKDQKNDVCGVRKVYGIQGRLKQLQYTADVAEFGEYPWQVAILKKNIGDKNLYLCGGVLIAPQWIATVAHCIRKDQTSPLLVRLGEWDVNRKDEVYPYVEKDVTTIVLHPEFNPESLENDLALIRMISPVDPRIPHINPACLPFPGQVFDDQKCWVSGWGKDFFGPKGAYQNVLKEVDVPVVSRALCSTGMRSTNLGPDFKLHPGFLCAGGEEGKDACTGDGGSPLVCTSNGLWYVVGLVSWGIGCGQPGIPGVYVNVLYYSDWINNIMRR